ncbi:phosphatase PAP2 family protein [Paracoccus sulfuroxidans]|uniref:Undecaprenyl-diphosphatase n=1 Tax=Paracoccus sulfuroxidans TaxID=384678 RepID=A0A562P199_9RHOB|nr:phosphatase PAP2 family protein [Paracoccus sulfuroxidans]TWI38268.1 undecaprenyl-diphosphatase [Paracoccus sulfuroxidans]
MSPHKPTEELAYQLGVALAFSCAIGLSMAFVDVPAAHLAATHGTFAHWVMRKLTLLGDSGWSIPMATISTFAAIAVGESVPKWQVQTWRNASLFVLINLCLSGIACIVLKSLVGRLRPDAADLESNLVFSHFSHSAHWASMPSGHTTTAMTVAFSLAAFFPRLRAPLITIAALVGLSRVVLGVHWVSDVLAGTWLAYITVTVTSLKKPRSSPFLSARSRD